MSRILVTGISGTGKSAALAELKRRGYRVVETDEPGWREYRAYEVPDELHRGEFLWVEERMRRLLDADADPSLFVAGCVKNQSTFYDRFDAVVLFSAPAEVILDRVERRTTNDYGKSPLERGSRSVSSQVPYASGAATAASMAGLSWASIPGDCWMKGARSSFSRLMLP